MMNQFTGKHVLVTGGSRGIGRAICQAFASRGAGVAFTYLRNKAAAGETYGSLSGGPHLMLRADIADPEAAGEVVHRTVSELGGLDVVVNNAGIYNHHRIDEVDYQQWRDAWAETINVNLLGPANVCHAAARHMIEAGIAGRIVNISSRGAFRGEPDMPAYAASKAGLNAMSQSLAQRLGRFHISVAVVAPGFVETDMAAPYLEGPDGDSIRNQSSLGRVARPDEVAAAVLFLCSDEAEFMTGAIIDVNGASYLRS